MSISQPNNNRNTSAPHSRRLAIIGGGLSGIAAAEHAQRLGFTPEIFEWSGTLGGRLSSFSVPGFTDEIDNGQHVSMNCNTELAGLHSRLSLEQFFVSSPLSFVNRAGKQYALHPFPFLPHRWKYLFAFLRFPFISFSERIKTLSLLKKLGTFSAKQNEQHKKCFAAFLAEHKVSNACINSFWQPMVLSALCETIDSVCVQAVADVVHGTFFTGCPLSFQIPAAPLKQIYHTAVAEKLQQLGIPVHYFSRVKRLYWNEAAENEPARVFALETASGEAFDFDYFILAVPIWRARDILNHSELEEYVDELGLERFESGAVTTVHLYLNRPILPPPQSVAVLLNGAGQFLVCHSAKNNTAGYKHTITISAAHRLLSDEELTAKGSGAVVEKVLQQLSASFPTVFSSEGQEPFKVLHSRVTTYFEAAFAPTVAVYSARPTQQTPFCNLALAGDWTQTGLPATMEGAVISGQKAAEVFAE
ncbi:MAG: FAD-dependent oxidoreductase [Planctomycetaceae bacterium]|nr:FAD-dependent oxidoreductase [Planctomycetaceae bacterium]